MNVGLNNCVPAKIMTMAALLPPHLKLEILTEMHINNKEKITKLDLSFRLLAKYKEFVPTSNHKTNANACFVWGEKHFHWLLRSKLPL